jgi:hypothetical protein
MMNIAPTIAATAANIAPPATPLSATNNICASLLCVLPEQLGQEVSVAVLIPAGGPVTYIVNFTTKMGSTFAPPKPIFEGPLYPSG